MPVGLTDDILHTNSDTTQTLFDILAHIDVCLPVRLLDQLLMPGYNPSSNLGIPVLIAGLMVFEDLGYGDDTIFELLSSFSSSEEIGGLHLNCNGMSVVNESQRSRTTLPMSLGTKAIVGGQQRRVFEVGTRQMSPLLSADERERQTRGEDLTAFLPDSLFTMSDMISESRHVKCILQ